MRISALALAAALSIVSGATAATRRHHTKLKGQIENTHAQGELPFQSIALPSLQSASSGSLVAHGKFIYALVGDKVYKLDPATLRVLSTQRLGAAARVRKARPKPSED